MRSEFSDWICPHFPISATPVADHECLLSLYGDSEELLGKWFKRTGKRGDIFLATKFGFVKGGKYEVDSSAEYCKKACDESLRALSVDYIDLCKYPGRTLCFFSDNVPRLHAPCQSQDTY